MLSALTILRKLHQKWKIIKLLTNEPSMFALMCKRWKYHCVKRERENVNALNAKTFRYISILNQFRPYRFWRSLRSLQLPPPSSQIPLSVFWTARIVHQLSLHIILRLFKFPRILRAIPSFFDLRPLNFLVSKPMIQSVIPNNWHCKWVMSSVIKLFTCISIQCSNLIEQEYRLNQNLHGKR